MEIAQADFLAGSKAAGYFTDLGGIRAVLVITRLDAIMQNKYSRSTPDKLAAWRSASHVERAAQRDKKPDGGTTPPPIVP